MPPIDITVLAVCSINVTRLKVRGFSSGEFPVAYRKLTSPYGITHFFCQPLDYVTYYRKIHFAIVIFVYNTLSCFFLLPLFFFVISFEYLNEYLLKD